MKKWIIYNPADTFETEEQTKTFIKAYDKEIKKIMGVI